MIHEHVVCPFCGCLCDDLEVTVEDGKVVNTKRGCIIAKSKFMNHDRDRAKPMLRKDDELIGVSIEEAIDRAAEILKSADHPLIYGLSSTECDAQRAATELAELVGGTIDNTASVCHGPTLASVQAIGVVKCTLGEIKNRADLVIFWGCNPGEAHMRHFLRYSVLSKGLFTQEGRKDRTVIVVDVRENASTKLADIFLKIRPNSDFEIISALRAAIKGHEVGDVAGVAGGTIKEVAEKMKSCKFGVLFFGLGLTMSKGKHMNIDAALSLVRDLNDYTKFAMNPMRGHFNVAGANEVLIWQTGYPYSVNFSRGYPRYNPGEFSAVDVLSRKECDAALIIAADPLSSFPLRASEHLAKIPTIVIDPKNSMTSLVAEVVIPTAMVGVECEGTAYRMDCIPIRLRKVVEPEFPSDKEVLEEIIEKVKAG
ncbi:MAG: formylmethanofuran dehydrogenase subunit B [Euryarchaeota archaeon]|nr:formylmethanofuran dehydrogenase subunit B [Euryarchaeota archaeon]